VATRDIRIWPDPCLTQVCTAVAFDDPDLPALIEDLFDTMYAAKGRGLAAPQIGVLQRIFVVDVTWKDGTPDPRLFINPVVTFASDEACQAEEQCLSIPDVPMTVDRPEQVQLTWYDPKGSAQASSFDGNLARCIQHEFDHLNGRVIFDHQTPDTRTRLEAAFAT